jgi:Fe2+ transport system protein B
MPDLVVVILDATNLKRNLLLYTQVADLKDPGYCCAEHDGPGGKIGHRNRY